LITQAVHLSERNAIGMPFPLRRFASAAAAGLPWPCLTETLVAPVLSAPPLATRVGGNLFCARSPKKLECGRLRILPEGVMRLIASYLATTSLVLVIAFASTRAQAADLDAPSTIDAVTVYPDGASVTRLITLDLTSGDNTLVARDFPLSLDPSSLRVEGAAAAKLTIGAIDARPPKPAPPANLSEIDKRIEALQDQRADLQGAIASAEARRKFAERFAEASPAGLGEKGEARPLADWRAAFTAVAEEVTSADAAIREAQRQQRDIDREIARLQSDRAAKPPSKLEVRIDLAAAAATRANLAGHLCHAQRTLDAALRCSSRHRRAGPQADA
jgi:N-terminal domain of unknown function (DUF4140)